MQNSEFTKIKETLEALGFSGYLGTDSVPLMKKVLNDLIRATKAFKSVQQEKSDISNELKLQGDLILPLRNENHKLIQDNNNLHDEIIKLKDKLDIGQSSNYISLKKSEERNQELKLIIQQKNNKIKELEYKILNMQEKLNSIFEKKYFGKKLEDTLNADTKFNSMTKGSFSPTLKTTLSNNGDFYISEPLLEPNNTNTNILQAFKNEINSSTISKLDWMKDLEKMGYENQKLREKIIELGEQNKKLISELEGFRSCLNSREDEIKRLQRKAYLTPSNISELKARYKVDFVSEQNEKLKRQNDFLNQENHRLNGIDWFHTHRCREEEIRKLDNEIISLKNSNKKLKEMLKKNGKK